MKKNDRLAMRGERYCLIKYLLLMKCSLIIILLTSFQSIAFTGTAQDLISMRVNNKSFSQVLKTIEAKYSYRFVYSDS
ncbi:hypothetical protein R1F44_29480, partial [Klebsiella sp. 128797]